MTKMNLTKKMVVALMLATGISGVAATTVNAVTPQTVVAHADDSDNVPDVQYNNPVADADDAGYPLFSGHYINTHYIDGNVCLNHFSFNAQAAPFGLDAFSRSNNNSQLKIVVTQIKGYKKLIQKAKQNYKKTHNKKYLKLKHAYKIGYNMYAKQANEMLTLAANNFATKSHEYYKYLK